MKKIFLTLIFFAILLITPNVQAAGNVSLSANKTSVNIGEEFTISISISGMQAASLTARVTVDTSKVEYVSGPSNSNFRNGRIIYTWTDPNGGDTPLTSGTIATFTLKARAGGTAGFSVSGDFYSPEETAINPVFSGVTVTIIEQEPAEPETPEVPETPTVPADNPTPSTPQEPETPPIEPTTEPQTEPETPDTQTTPNTPTEQNTPENPPTPPTIPNTQVTPATPSTSENNQTAELGSNTNLKSLRLDVATIVPDFQTNTLQYTAAVNETISDIDVLAVPEDTNSNISITGNHDLQIGENLIQVTVVAQNGDKKTYNITVTKTEAANLANSYLENLAIENAFLVPEFRYDIFTYTVDIGSSQDSLNILAVPQRESANVRIEGKENLVFGENTIIIVVTSEDGTSSNTYTIKAYRKTEGEEIQDEKGEDLNDEDMTETENESTNEKERKENSFSNVVMAAIITIGALGVIGMLIWKYRSVKSQS